MDKSIKFAYIISSYKLPKQTVRLVERLNLGSSIFIIHIDKNSSEEIYRIVYEGLKKYDNVVFLKRHRCNWGDFGHVRATLKGIEYLEGSRIDYRFLVLLTGQCYPIKNTKDTTKFLLRSNKSHIQYFPLPSNNWQAGGVERWERAFFWLNGRRYSLPRRSSSKPWLNRLLSVAPIWKYELPAYTNLYGGSSYWVIKSDHVRYIQQFVVKYPEYTKFFENSFIPDEMFFQTILLNSPYQDELVNDNLFHIDWTDSKELPKVFRNSDFEKLSKSDQLFARKFDETIDSDILDRIDNEILMT